MSSNVFGFFTRRAACAAVGLVALLASAPARADVVFGNLNAAEDRPLGTTETTLGSGNVDAINWLAQGFNTNSATLLDVQSVLIGLRSTSGTVPITVSIFGDVSGSPGSSPLFTSSPTSVSTTNKYSFTFTGATLQANTAYWIVPNGGSWFFNTGSAAPVGLNSSGYTYVGTKESQSTAPTPASASWDAGASSRYSVSITAVPEPSTLGLAGVGLVTIVGLEARRRLRRPLGN